MTQPIVFGLAYSPWTYKARWALARAGIQYRYREYLPMVGKAGMRLRLNRWSSPITVPLMQVGKDVYSSSWDIACFADGDDALQTSNPAVKRWNESADRLLELGRIRISLAIQDDRDALKAAVPPMLQNLPGAVALAKMGANYMLKTYPVSTQPEHIEKEMAAILEQVREGLSGRATLGDKPSYADMTVASSLQMISPVSEALIPLDPRLKSVWSSPTLAESFGDLCAWRDEIFRVLDAPRFGA